MGKKAPSGLFQWLGVVLVECRSGVGSSSSSGPLFIGDPRGVAVNGVAPASDYGEARVGKGIWEARHHQGGSLVSFPC